MLFLTTILFLFGCSKGVTPSNVQKIKPGVSTLRDVISLLDEPQKILPQEGHYNSETYIWDDISVQVEKRFVHSVVRPPFGDETSIQHWFYRYKKDHTSMSKIDETTWKLDIPNEGFTVMYDKQLDRVTKVIHYEVE